MERNVKAKPKFFLWFKLVLALMPFSSVAFADTVYVWCADGTIHRFNSNGVELVFPTTLSGWNGPVGLAVNDVGILHAGFPGGSKVVTFSTSGVGQWPDGSVDSVSGLSFDGTGTLYVTIPNYYSITRPEYSAGFGYWFGPGVFTQSHLGDPLNISFNAAGQMIVVNGTAPGPFTFPNAFTNTVQKFDTNFTHLGTIATGLRGAWGSAIDSAGNLYVSTTDDHSIRRFATNGAVQVVSDYFDDWLYQPKGIAFDSLGYLFVANSGNGTVVKFAPNGTSTVIASNLISPTSIAIYPGLKLWRVPIRIANQMVLPNGAFQFGFATNPYGTNTVFATTNFADGWTPIGTAVEVSPGEYQFTDTQATNSVQRFYRVRNE